MNVVMDDELIKKLERIREKDHWPVAELAKMLERPRMFIYRMVDAGKFVVLNDGKHVKITSASVISYYTEKTETVSEDDAFRKGFEIGIALSDLARERGVSLQYLGKVLNEYCGSVENGDDHEQES
jgi:hypothetical protein